MNVLHDSRPSPATPSASHTPQTDVVSDTEGLTATGVGKSYKGRQVVRNVSVTLQRGEAVGLLGPNGAGCFARGRAGAGGRARRCRLAREKPSAAQLAAIMPPPFGSAEIASIMTPRRWRSARPARQPLFFGDR